MCRDGFTFDEIISECVRNALPDIVTATPLNVVKEVATNIGKLRLVNDGICQDLMSGRIEVQLNNVYVNGLNLGPPFHLLWDHIVEPRVDEWFTVRNTFFSEIEATTVCQTMFGFGAELLNIHTNSSCGKSESRSMLYDCSNDYSTPTFWYSYYFNFPARCRFEGPYQGCTGFACELDEDEGPLVNAWGATQEDMHTAVSCGCLTGYEFDEGQMKCIRKNYDYLIVTPTPPGIVKQKNVQNVLQYRTCCRYQNYFSQAYAFSTGRSLNGGTRSLNGTMDHGQGEYDDDEQEHGAQGEHDENDHSHDEHDHVNDGNDYVQRRQK